MKISKTDLCTGLVIYNVVFEGQLVQTSYLYVVDQQLTFLIYSRRGLTLLTMPGMDVPYIQETIIPNQVFFLQRISYINTLLIQSRGVVRNPPCDRCIERMYPFLECRRVPGHFGGYCENCKWPDHAARCTVNNDDDDDDDSDSSVEFTGGRVIQGSGSQATSIVVD